MKDILFRCWVPGKPAAQGGTVPIWSPKKKRYVQVTKGSDNLGAWRVAMTKAFALIGKTKYGVTRPLNGPLGVRMTFVMPRLADHPKKKDGKFWAETVLDWDKLIRAAGDSLTKSEIIADDARICASDKIRKRYAMLRENPGILVEIYRLSEDDDDGYEYIPEARK